jgi:acyl-CoA synthetase (AMP-forming)/AMP-acid ligase II
MAELVSKLDKFLGEVLSSYNVWTAVIAGAVVALLAVAFITSKDPDIHPLLLAHAASPDRVRQPGESAVYRSHDVANGYPLRTGLDVKYPGDKTYSPGRDGTVKDIWDRFIGASSVQVKETDVADRISPRLSTILGKELIEHDLKEVTQEINVIGRHVNGLSAARVAIYLPNSVELLASVIAGATYGFSVILIPFDQPHETIIDLLHQTSAEVLIAEAGSLPLSSVVAEVGSVKGAVWVVERTSRHIEWKEVPSEIGGKVDISVWHELVDDHSNESGPVLPEAAAESGAIITVWQDKPGSTAEVVSFSSANIVAAVSAAIHALPRSQRLGPKDLFLPADSLAKNFVLVQTLAALFQRSNIAINSVAGAGVPLSAAASCVAPTVIVASAEIAAGLHAAYLEAPKSPLQRLRIALASRTLAGGTMPRAVFSTIMGLGEPSKLRLLVIAHRAGCATSPALPGKALSNLRAATGARVIYALTSARVAGAISQSGIYDYRVDNDTDDVWCHFGAPLSCLEIKVVDTAAVKTTNEKPQGEIAAAGPSVAGGSTNIGVLGWFRKDHCLACL